MPKLSIRDVDLTGKRVFIRVDFNVPMNDAGEITDDSRVRASQPTIQLALERGAKLILASHLGRPNGKPNPKMSLQPVAIRLGRLLGKPVLFAKDCVGREVEKQAGALRAGEVLLLENLRFHAEEEKNDPRFAQRLAALAQVFVNDAFGAAHRAHASTVAITRYLSPAATGLLMEKELEYLQKAVANPARPYVAVLGGAKVSDKIDLLQNLVQLTDCILVGGAMAYTLLKARGVGVGQSRVEDDKLDKTRELLWYWKKGNIDIRLPGDHVAAKKIDATASPVVTDGPEIPPNLMGADIGPATRAEYVQEIAGARTVLWNGPMGVFEIRQFAEGTFEVARAIAASSAISIVGGGDSAAAVVQAGVADKITHISTGGGASLEFLSGMKLPGVEALTEKQ